MNNRDFYKLKKELMPLDLQKHFEKNQEILNRNVKRYENMLSLEKKIDTPEEFRATIDYLLDSLKNSESTASVLFDHCEMLFFVSVLLRKQIESMEKTLKGHGMIIERIEGYEEGLRFVNDYIKHHPDGDKI